MQPSAVQSQNKDCNLGYWLYQLQVHLLPQLLYLCEVFNGISSAICRPSPCPSERPQDTGLGFIVGQLAQKQLAEACMFASMQTSVPLCRSPRATKELQAVHDVSHPLDFAVKSRICFARPCVACLSSIKQLCHC